MNIGCPQRFGPQFHSEGNGPFRLYAVDSGNTAWNGCAFLGRSQIARSRIE